MSNEGYTPPPPPDENGDYQEEGYAQDGQARQQSFDSPKGPKVAAPGGKNLVLIVLGAALAIFLIYQLFFSGGGDEIPSQNNNMPQQQAGGGVTVAPATEIPLPAEPIQPPPLPPPPPLPQEEPAPLPPPPPVTPDIDFSGSGPSNEELQQRRASQMLISNNPDKVKKEETKTEKSEAERAVAKEVGDLDYLVLQGKIIDAVLESAVDTSLAGPIRAITSRDIYAESNYQVLIPKGSRLIGTYNTDIVRGQARVFIIWTRLILPDGIDIMINSQAVDPLGRSGIEGFSDERYFEIFSSAVLTSLLSIGIAAGTEAAFDTGSVTETKNTDGSTTSSGTPTAKAALEGAANIATTARSVVGGLLDIRPNITLDQGTPFKVFVNRDLEFPERNPRNKVRFVE